MADINRCVFTGRIGTEIKMRRTASGVSVCSFRIAVDRPKAKGAEKAEPDWLDLVAWRQQADFIDRYLSKGRKIVVECEARTRVWTDQDGGKRKAVEFNIVNLIPADAKSTAAPDEKPAFAPPVAPLDFDDLDGNLPF